MNNAPTTWTEEQVTACCDGAAPNCRPDPMLNALVTQLQSDPAIEPSDLLKPRIMAAVQTNRHQQRKGTLLKIAAGLIVFASLAGILLPGSTHDSKSVALDRGIDWLNQQQQSDGSWRPSTWGGSDEFATGVTALSLMALVKAKDSDATERARKRATAYLVNFLNEATPQSTQAFSYNHSLATLALLESYAQRPEPATQEAIDSAVQAIIKQQSASGGWGYHVSTGLEYGAAAPANSAITIWPLAVLKRADAQGWTEARPVLAKATHWMSNLVDEQGYLGYRSKGDFPHGPDTLLAMGLCNLPEAAPGLQNNLDQLNLTPENMYRAFFTAQALNENASNQLLTLQQDLMAAQVADGSWESTDPWAKAGGRVYATAMASMSLSY